MHPWNVLATSQRFRESKLRRQLSPFKGKWRHTGFRDVIVGWVEDKDYFMREIQSEYEKFPFNLAALSKLVPIDKTFEFTVEDFFEKAKEAVRPYIESIGDGSFHTRIERRGHKGELDSHTLEQELGEYIHGELEKLGRHPTTDFKDPDMIVLVETIGDEAGVALVTREMREKCHFVRIK
jgi:tRNA(Ser,Leu) C12 N-acetylase TAN1